MIAPRRCTGMWLHAGGGGCAAAAAVHRYGFVFNLPLLHPLSHQYKSDMRVLLFITSTFSVFLHHLMPFHLFFPLSILQDKTILITSGFTLGFPHKISSL